MSDKLTRIAIVNSDK
ncbi:hypothetical protein F53441_14348, partial [Fusarium austroafricanum]